MITLEFDFTEGAIPKVLDRILSGLLPHQNFDRAKYGRILESMFKYIKLEEMKMEYYVLAKLLSDYKSIGLVDADFIPMLMREELESYIEAEAYELVLEPVLGMAKWMSFNGLPNNLMIESTREMAANRLYELVMDKYDSLLEMECHPDVSLSAVATLRNILPNEIAKTSIKIQHKILSSGMESNRNWYRGGKGWWNYQKQLINTIDIRMNEDDVDYIHIKDAESEDKITRDAIEAYMKIGDTPWKPINKIGYATSRLSVIVGDESVGKTATTTTLAAGALARGIGVVYVVTESKKGIIWARIMSSYIKIKYNKFVTIDQIREVMPSSEEARRLTKIASAEIRDAGLLTLVGSIEYNKVYDRLMDLYMETRAQFFVIDHSGDLISDGRSTDTQNVEKLTTDSIKIKNKIPVHIVVNSHASSLARELASKGKEIRQGSTRGSVKLSQGADDVYYLTTSEDMDVKKIRMVNVLKSRGGDNKGSRFIIKMMDEISTTMYDESLQNVLDNNIVDKQALTDELRKSYSTAQGLDSDNDLADEMFDLNFDDEDDDFGDIEM